MDQSTVSLNIEGMACGGCVTAVERALGGVPGVRSVAVSLADSKAVVSGTAEPAAMVQAVKTAGFDASTA
jgi:copper chaperone CopZ